MGSLSGPQFSCQLGVCKGIECCAQCPQRQLYPARIQRTEIADSRMKTVDEQQALREAHQVEQLGILECRLSQFGQQCLASDQRFSAKPAVLQRPFARDSIRADPVFQDFLQPAPG